MVAATAAATTVRPPPGGHEDEDEDANDANYDDLRRLISSHLISIRFVSFDFISRSATLGRLQSIEVAKVTLLLLLLSFIRQQ